VSETLHFDTLVAAVDPAVDLIFVHGLAGDPYETWTSAGEVWPRWLAEDLPGASINTLGYGTGFLAKWAAKQMNLYELAESALEHMAGHGIGTRPLAFVCHSLGGLVVKQMLRSAGEASSAPWQAIADQTRLVAFIATPHQGATIAQVFTFIAPKLSSKHIDLIADETGALKNLNDAYRDLAPARGIRTLAYYETHKAKKAAFIVDKISADPGVAGTRAIALNGDHISVCKPADRRAPLYASLRAHLSDVFGSSDGDTGKAEPAAPAAVGNIAVASGAGSIAVGGDASGATFTTTAAAPAPEILSSDEQDAVNRTRVETAAKGWDFRVVVSVDLKSAGERFTDVADALGAAGGEVFQEQVHGFILDALEGAGVTASATEGVWQWTGDGALLAFAKADLGHDFAMALHGATDMHNRGTRSPAAERRFRVGMAATDDPTRESWNVTVMRAVRLESKADTDGNLIDVNTWKGLHSTNGSLYGPVEQVPGKRDDEFYPAHRYTPASVIPPLEEPKTSVNPRLHNLPPDVAHFKGCGAEEAALLQALKGGSGTQAITALKGIGGIGKSALAVRVARQLVPHYPAAQILVDLRGTETDPLTPRAAMEDVIRRFDPESHLPNDDDGVAEIYRGTLTQHKSLLILDNARDGAQVQSLLPPLPSAAIITSRRQVDLPTVISHTLDNLFRADAVALLADLFVERAPTKVPDNDALDQLAAACADHPLALAVAGIYAANRAGRIDFESHVQQIEERRESLRLDSGDDYDVMAGLALSLHRLAEEDPDLAENWRDLSVFPADFDAAAAAAVWAAEDARDTLMMLEDASFLEPGSAAERFRLHDLMRDLARLDQSEYRFAAAKTRHSAHFLSVLTAADDLYRKGGAQNTLDGLAQYDLEQANIRIGQALAVAAMKEAALAEAGALVLQYANAGTHVLSLRLHPRDQILWCEEAVEGARLSENWGGQGVALGNLGLAYADLGEMDKAIDYYGQTLVIHRKVGDRRGEGAALGNLGIAYAAVGETDTAIYHFEQQLVITREIRYRRGEAIALGNLGLAYAGLGDLEKAIEHHEQDLVITREIGDRRGEGAALGNLGIAYANLGENDKAVNRYQQQLVITREIGDKRGEGNALANLGVAYKNLDHFAEARDAWTAALVLYVAIDDPNAEKVREWLAALDG